MIWYLCRKNSKPLGFNPNWLLYLVSLINSSENSQTCKIILHHASSLPLSSSALSIGWLYLPLLGWRSSVRQAILLDSSFPLPVWRWLHRCCWGLQLGIRVVFHDLLSPFQAIIKRIRDWLSFRIAFSK